MLSSNKQDYLSLPSDVAEAIYSIFTGLGDKKLLERCVDNFMQNGNGS